MSDLAQLTEACQCLRLDPFRLDLVSAVPVDETPAGQMVSRMWIGSEGPPREVKVYFQSRPEPPLLCIAVSSPFVWTPDGPEGNVFIRPGDKLLCDGATFHTFGWCVKTNRTIIDQSVFIEDAF